MTQFSSPGCNHRLVEGRGGHRGGRKRDYGENRGEGSCGQEGDLGGGGSAGQQSRAIESASRGIYRFCPIPSCFWQERKAKRKEARL